jgi:hypothetical protein
VPPRTRNRTEVAKKKSVGKGRERGKFDGVRFKVEVSSEGVCMCMYVSVVAMVHARARAGERAERKRTR